MFELVIGILFPVFFLVMIGYVIGRAINPDFAPINRLNIDFFLPALVFSSLGTMPLDLQQVPLLMAALVSIFVPLVVMWPLCRYFGLRFKTWTPPHMFRNSGNLAIPLFTYTFGSQAVSSAVLLFVISSCLHVSFGLMIMSQGNPIKHILKTPTFLATLLALALNLSGIGLWAPLYEGTHLLGQAAVPIMLLSLGSQMKNMRWTGLRIGLLCTAQSLLTGAIAFLLIDTFIELPTLQRQMMVLFTMLPPAVMNYLFAERMDNEPDKVAAMVLFGNFFGLLTLPLLLTLALSLG
ncbi:MULTISPECIES: AEC family transporter [unclassified Vibrio]|uniref:AEC family transporter n=1 Tax=Vibrio sp. HB236076 TaxID=3232307 RepID=A0AB39HJI9_9VIBR|nr:AEC family transporter [Vibrio sp. HB161653]MDP5253148.1 AEC family transporter [Vibrio sp. HB161653]